MDSATDQTEAGQLPLRKRKQSDEGSSPVATAELTPEPETKQQKALSVEDGTQPLRRGTITKAREIRLEQNRKAARESRRRKKVMIEELQRSVIFFSRANGTLKQQNEELSRLLIQAQAQVAALEGHHQGASTQPPQQQPLAQVKQEVSQRPPQQSGHFQQAEANAVAAQAVYESQGFPAAAARAVAQTMNGAPLQEVATVAITPNLLLLGLTHPLALWLPCLPCSLVLRCKQWPIFSKQQQPLCKQQSRVCRVFLV